ncbi:MAG: hypothetical protein ABR597_12360, partial [Bacteroidales bacterium]
MGLKPFVKSRNAPLAYVKPFTDSMPSKPQVARNLVFIRYRKDAGMQLSPVSITEALQHFHQEAWVGDNMERAERFINWFCGLRFYSLEYSNNRQAVDALKKLTQQP